MYTREDRKRVVDLWLKYDKCSTAVTNELGYPCTKIIKSWYKSFLKEEETGIIQVRRPRTSKYTQEQKQTAIDHYLDHGRCLARTIRVLGYPCLELLATWCREYTPTRRKHSKDVVHFTPEQKQEAVLSFSCRRGGAQEIAEAYKTSRTTLYKWQKNLLGKENAMPRREKRTPNLLDDKEKLLSEIEQLKIQVHKLQIEKDILEATAELIKKDPGVDQNYLSNREKATLIGALKNKHPLNDLLASMNLSRSSYYYQCWAQSFDSKYIELQKHIIELFNSNNRCYGYRRIHFLLTKEGITVSEKVVRMLMDEAKLVTQRKHKRKYTSYIGEISTAPDNLLNRNFQADVPNEKWLTDITEFHIPAGKVYLSPVIDCYDGMIVSWTLSTQPDAKMVNTMLDLATDTIEDGIHPIIHSDRGCHYRWPGWIERIEKAALVQSMSKKGCSPDNSACEGFFGRIKTEMFYNRSWTGVSIESFIEILNSYLHWYNSKRIKMSLGGMSPIQYRQSLGIAV